MPSNKAALPVDTEKPSETKKRILDTALRSFNERGVNATAVLKIAMALGMSPGNLTYHFKRKSDIVMALVLTLREKIEEAVSDIEHPLKPSPVIDHLELTLRTLWSYRFLLNSAVYVSQMDDELSDQLKFLKKTIVDMLARNYAKVIENGEMRAPRQSDGVQLLADNTFGIWLQWLQAESIAHPVRDTPTDAGLYICLRHHYSLIDPYVSKGFSKSTWDELDRRYANL